MKSFAILILLVAVAAFAIPAHQRTDAAWASTESARAIPGDDGSSGSTGPTNPNGPY